MKADELMDSAIHTLAKQRPDLCDQSGRGFWPVPVHFPRLLSKTLDALQREVSERYLRHDPTADTLASVRMDFMRVVGEGDLGENHTKLFLADHPGIANVTPEESDRLPFGQFCRSILTIDDPVLLMAILTRNEEGGLAEAQALADTKLIKPDGPFALTHLREEEVHGRISADMRKKLLSISEFEQRFHLGETIHDQFYLSILDAR